jgi:hypothetical protein
VTFQKDQIQGLIAEIDGVLQKTTPRLPWVKSADANQQRRLLEKVRNFLVALQRRTGLEDTPRQPEGQPNLLAYDISYQSAQPATLKRNQGGQEGSAQQMLQTIVQEMSYLRANLMQPLQAELEALQQQREALLQEVRQLEGQRQGYGAAGQMFNQQQLMNEFLQTLMHRLQETLPQQIAQTLQNSGDPALLGANPSQPALQAMSQADQTLVNFDTTLKIVFEALQRDVQAYQASLSQGLDRMHTLGQQGEMMFSALISHLAEQVGRGVSYLQVPVRAELKPEAAAPAEATIAPPEIQQPMSAEQKPVQTVSAPPQPPIYPVAPTPPNPMPGTPMAFPYAGIEISTGKASGATDSATIGIDAAIDSWIRAVGAVNTEETEAGVADLDLSDLNLNDLELSPMDVQELDSLLEEASSSLSSEPISPPGLGLLSQEACDRPTRPLATPQPIEPLPSSSEAAIGPFADAQLLSEDARDELDEFYQSLFGAEGKTESAAEVPATRSTSPELGDREATAIATPSTTDLAQHKNREQGQANQQVAELTPAAPDVAASATGTVQRDLDDAPAVRPAPGDEITSLTDLFADLDAPALATGTAATHSFIAEPDLALEGSAASALVPQEASPGDTWTDDLYIPASPEENLLPAEEPIEEATTGIWLDDLLLNHLHEDLSNLEESLSSSATSAAGVESELTAWILDDLANQPQPPLTAATEGETLEDFVTALSELETSTGDQDASVEPVRTAASASQSSESASFSLDMLFPDHPVPDRSDDAADSPSAVDQPIAFTLAGMDDLFADSPATPALAESQSIASTPTADQPVTFTLAGMDDLFADPSAPPSEPPSSPAPAIEELTLEGMFEEFLDPAAIHSPPDSPASSPLARQPQTPEKKTGLA